MFARVSLQKVVIENQAWMSNILTLCFKMLPNALVISDEISVNKRFCQLDLYVILFLQDHIKPLA